MKITKKITKIISRLFILGLLIFIPNFILAAENNHCKNSYISNVIPGSNDQLDSFKYFLFELDKNVDQSSVEFYINKEKQKVNLVKKENGTGYLAFIKADQNLNKPGSLLLEIAASGSNKNKCNSNLFVGLEIKKPSLSPTYNHPVIKDNKKNEISSSTNIKTTSKKVVSTNFLEKKSDGLINKSAEDINNQTASINNSLESPTESAGTFTWITTILIIVFLALLFKPKKKTITTVGSSKKETKK